MNESLFRWINGWPESLSPVFVFFSEATKHPAGKVLFVALALALIASGKKGRAAFVFGAIALGIANATTDVLKASFQMPRPCVELEDVILRVGKLTSYGTASAHSANMAALATVFILVWGVRGTFWVPVALITGLSRIYVGVHYPSQVLLGWTCGVFAALVVVKTWEAWNRARQAREEGEELADGQHPAGPG